MTTLLRFFPSRVLRIGCVVLYLLLCQFVMSGEYDRILLTTYLCPTGFCLCKVDPVTGLSTAPFATPAYLEMMNQDSHLLRTRGAQSIILNAYPEDQQRCEAYLLEGMRQLPFTSGRHIVVCPLFFRILMKGPSCEYQWIKETTYLSKLDGHEKTLTIVSSSQVCEESVNRMYSILVEERSLKMLSALSQKAYDCCLWTDDRLRILSDTGDCRKWLLGSSTRSLLKIPLESFVPLDHNKLALRDFAQIRTRDAKEVAPLRVRINIAHHILAEVDVYIYPVRECGGQRLKYLVAMRLVSGQQQSGGLRHPRRVSTRELGEQGIQMSKYNLAVSNDHFRQILSDWTDSVENSLRQPRVRSWIIPVRLAGRDAVSEYLLMVLPSHIQGDFTDAANRGDYHACCQMLSFTIHGNANIFSARMSTDNSDLVICAFQFLLDLAPKLAKDSARQFSLLSQLQDALKHLLVHRLDKERYIAALYGFTITLLSTAVMVPKYYAREIAIKWLRTVFVEALEIPVDNNDGKVLIVYWICILWSGAMHAFGTQRRTEEAVAVLKKLVGEIEGFKNRYPFSLVANQALFVALHNLTSLDGIVAKKDKRKYTEKLQRDVLRTDAFRHLIAQ